MRELLRTNDAVLLSFVEALLREACYAFHIADMHISLAEGSIGAFPRRVLIDDDVFDAARDLLVAAGLAAELPDGGSEGASATAALPPRRA
ncbi:MAG: DUF2007 domain-containing protein [Hyphomicrobiaceae bacterium]|nr:DUF2007 domain-containing protein [Hyphomicrobiaceae bacterium]